MTVLDASALVDILLGQEDAPWLLDQLAGGDVVAPAHQLAEVLSALTRLERAGILAPEAARDAVTAAVALPQELVPLAGLTTRAFELRDRFRVLDGFYVALAEERGTALLTTDIRLARANPPCAVIVPRG
ncbi:hypothetical protein GCM10023169_01220 [Georgenia halophila]|uniref:Ribonuclease VapC n=1 Tax=Georgenia halophila TaxID=620889 RepID=A0ABP8KSF4_9MICO